MNQSGILHNALQSLRSDVREDLFKTLRTLQWVLKAGYDDREHAFEAMETYAPVYGFFRRELTILANRVPHGRVPLRVDSPPTSPAASQSRHEPTRRNSLKSQAPDSVHLERLHIATSRKRARSGSSSEDDVNETRPDKRRLRRG